MCLVELLKVYLFCFLRNQQIYLKEFKPLSILFTCCIFLKSYPTTYHSSGCFMLIKNTIAQNLRK